MVLRFLKLTQSYCINKFPFFLCYSQVSFKFASNSFQVCFKFVSNSLQIRSRICSLSEFFKNSLQFVLENCLHLSICFKLTSEAKLIFVKIEAKFGDDSLLFKDLKCLNTIMYFFLLVTFVSKILS